MKNYIFAVICGLFILAIAIGGCGGGGGGGSSSDGGTSGLTSIRAEAVLAGAPTQPIDPLNIQAGETVQFQVVGYDSNRQRHVIASSNWTTNDNGNVGGSLQPDGTLTATNSTGPSVFTASGSANGGTFTIGYRIKPIQALITGHILDSNGFGASHVAIVFYNSSGVEVSKAISQFDGSFRASSPTSAQVFNLDPATLPKAFYFRSFVFQTKRYTALDKSCSAPVPALTNGTTTSLGTVTVDATKTNGFPNPPPPPPNGCPIT